MNKACQRLETKKKKDDENTTSGGITNCHLVTLFLFSRSEAAILFENIFDNWFSNFRTKTWLKMGVLCVALILFVYM